MTSNREYVCDTNVLLSSLLSRKSPPAQVVKQIRTTGLFAFSLETLSELEEVLDRPKFDRFIDKKYRIAFVRDIKAILNLYEIHHKVELCRDPKDNKFLDVAIASDAEYLITGDEDLLVLENVKNTTIITPRHFVTEVI